jgi:hypothetical protein
MPAVQQTIDQVRRIDVDQYKYGFETKIESVKAPRGLNEGIVRFISEKKGEPAWMLEWRLDSYRRWKTMTEPTWANVHYVSRVTRDPSDRPVSLRGGAFLQVGTTRKDSGTHTT